MGDLRRFVREPVLWRGEGVPSHRARRSSHRAPLPQQTNSRVCLRFAAVLGNGVVNRV